MKVILAEYSGFCFGVKKAIDTAYHKIDEKKGDQFYSLGPLIHNPQVVEELKEKGIGVIDDIDEIEGGNIIIRSHGVPERIYRIAEGKNISIIDSTCPFVRRIQKIVKEYHDKGCQVVIIGDPKHPEVIGINGWCNDKGIILHKDEDVEKIKEDTPTCVVVQTTMSISLYEEFIEKIKNKVTDIKIFNTICLATRQRQEAAKKLSKEVDAMLVVGGYQSSNTQKLVAICREEKPDDTYHIETVDEINLEKLKKYNSIGVTAGASTPPNVIDDVLEKIKNLK